MFHLVLSNSCKYIYIYIIMNLYLILYHIFPKRIKRKEKGFDSQSFHSIRSNPRLSFFLSLCIQTKGFPAGIPRFFKPSCFSFFFSFFLLTTRPPITLKNQLITESIPQTPMPKSYIECIQNSKAAEPILLVFVIFEISLND